MYVTKRLVAACPRLTNSGQSSQNQVDVTEISPYRQHAARALKLSALCVLFVRVLKIRVKIYETLQAASVQASNWRVRKYSHDSNSHENNHKVRRALFYAIGFKIMNVRDF